MDTSKGREWTEEEDKFLRENVKTSTMSSMAAHFTWRSRNAVIGRVNRLKINAGNIQKSGKLPTGPKRQDKAVAVTKQTSHVAPPEPPRAKLGVVEEDVAAKKSWPKPMTKTARLFLEMPTVGFCRMPLWGDSEPLESRFYCGAATVAASSYCPSCHGIIHDAPPKRISA